MSGWNLGSPSCSLGTEVTPLRSSKITDLFIQLEVEREAIESERKRMTEEEEKLLERKKEAESKLHAEMSELQLLRNDQVNFNIFPDGEFLSGDQKCCDILCNQE